MQVLNGTKYIFMFFFGVLLKRWNKEVRIYLLTHSGKKKEFPVSPFSFGKEKNVRTLNSHQQS